MFVYGTVSPGDGMDTALGSRSPQARPSGEARSTGRDPLGADGLSDPLVEGLVDPIQRAVDTTQNFPNGALRVQLDPVNSLGLYAGNKPAPSVDAKVTYTPTAQAPDADPIRLVQIVRTENPSTGAVGSWAGSAEARRDKTQTAADANAGVQAGWFVDHTAEAWKPRSKTQDPAVPDAYVDASKAEDPHAELGSPMKSYAELGGGDNQNGRKAGADVTPAKLKDQPASTQQYDFRAEVVVKGKEAGGEQIYGRADWSFDTEPDGTGGQKLRTHQASFAAAPSANFQPAIDKYDEVYRNAGAATSPEEVARLKGVVKGAPGTEAATNARAALAAIFDRLQANALPNDGMGLLIEKMLLEQEIGPLVEAAPNAQENVQDPFDDEDDWADFQSADAQKAPSAFDDDDWANFDAFPSVQPAASTPPQQTGNDDDWAKFDD